MPKPIRFKEVVDFYFEIWATTELRGTTEDFEREFKFVLEHLRGSLSLDQPLDQLRLNTVLGPHGVKAFTEFKAWWARHEST